MPPKEQRSKHPRTSLTIGIDRICVRQLWKVRVLMGLLNALAVEPFGGKQL